MATLRQLRTRIGSIGNIQRVTNAMQMVAAAKMRRAQEAIQRARPYARQLDRLLRQVHRSVDAGRHPLLAARPGERRILAVVTADRGLCGAFNASICRRAQAEVEAGAVSRTRLVTVGRKARDFFGPRGCEIAHHHAGVFLHPPTFQRAVEIARDLSRRFAAGEADRVLLVFSAFRSIARQEPVVEQLLPLVPAEPEEDEGAAPLFEPAPEALLESLVPRQLNFRVWRALLESNAGEQAARMSAMDNATRNAGELIEELTRAMNKERQTSITLELMDIVGGAEAVSH